MKKTLTRREFMSIVSLYAIQACANFNIDDKESDKSIQDFRNRIAALKSKLNNQLELRDLDLEERVGVKYRELRVKYSLRFAPINHIIQDSMLSKNNELFLPNDYLKGLDSLFAEYEKEYRKLHNINGYSPIYPPYIDLRLLDF